MRTNRKRVAVPFLFRADDALGAGGKLIARVYGNEVEGVFTRADAAWHDTVREAGSATLYRMTRAAHSQPRLGSASVPGNLSATVTDIPALTLEAGTTNLVANSEDFSAWTDSSVTVTTNAVVAPDGTTTADLLDATSATTDERYQAVTFTGNGTKAVSVFLRANTATEATVILRDATAGVNRVRAVVTLSSGSVSRAEGTGPVWSVPYVDPSGNAWVRVMLSVDGVVAANTNRVTVRPDTALGTGSVYAWGAQAEDTAIPTSYVKTSGSTVARAADVLYFPFTLKPQEMTVYVKGVERAFPSVADPSNAQVYLTFGDNAAAPLALLLRTTATTGYRMAHQPSGVLSQTAASTLGTAASVGSVVELRGVLSSGGACTMGVTVDGGAESTNGPSTAEGLAAAWNVARLYLHSTGAGSAPVNFSYTHVCIALGTKTMAEMRVLAEVG